MNDIAILIDCWDDDADKGIDFYLETFYNRIIQFVQSTDSIKTVILASYDCHPKEYRSNSIWYQNAREFLGEDNYRKMLNDNFVFLKDFTNTDPIIFNWVSNKQQIAMRTGEELGKFLSQNQVSNIYMCGKAWEFCVKNRPLGYLAVNDIIRDMSLDTKILVKDDCVINIEWQEVLHKNIQFDKNWKQTSDIQIFEYCPQGQ